ncbi:hypothetical protein I3760_01G210700 [Carya illinoinensis]|nr:hypothetical protein I3760_01G210700 [Carya illinoinensis]
MEWKNVNETMQIGGWETKLRETSPVQSTLEEWVVCHVFQETVVKKPQQITPISSQLPSNLESPCETKSNVNEFGDVELPNLNINIANSSSR